VLPLRTQLSQSPKRSFSKEIITSQQGALDKRHRTKGYAWNHTERERLEHNPLYMLCSFRAFDVVSWANRSYLWRTSPPNAKPNLEKK
jgi:hypothetical protein